MTSITDDLPAHRSDPDLDDLISPDAGPADGVPEFDPLLIDALLERMFREPEFLAFCTKNVPPKAFHSIPHQFFVQACYQHYEQFGRCPSELALTLALERAAAGRKDRLLIVSTGHGIIEYVHSEDTEFLKAEALFLAKQWKVKKAFGKLLEAQDLSGLDDFYKAVDETRALDQADTFQVYDEGELDTLPDPAWAVEQHVPAAGLVTVTADSNVGKTFYAIDLSYSVATGRRFFGEYDVRQGAVLYVYSEGQAGAKRRRAAWKSFHGVESAPVRFVPSSLDFSQEITGRTLIEKATAKGWPVPDVVVIDTLTDNFGGGDTSDHKDMRRFLATVNLLRQQYGCAVVVLHHTGWDSKRERGAKSIRDAADVAIFLDRKDDEIVVSCEKMRDGERFSTYHLKPQKHSDSLVLTRLGTKAEIEAENRQSEEATEFESLKAHVPVTPNVGEGITLSMLLEVTGIKRTTLQRLLAKGCEGEVWHKGKVPGSGANQPFQYHRLH
jgi:hypothetical protein